MDFQYDVVTYRSHLGIVDHNGNMIAGGDSGPFGLTADLFFGGQNITTENFHLLNNRTKQEFLQKLAMTLLNERAIMESAFAMSPLLKIWTALLVRKKLGKISDSN